jgi:hypothetical protein
MSLRSRRHPQFETLKDCAAWALVQGVPRKVDQDGRRIGYTYEEILAFVRSCFPKISYPGPHKGRKCRMTQRHLRELFYRIRIEQPDLRFPRRPRGKQC